MNLHLNPGDRVLVPGGGYGSVAEIIPVGLGGFMARVALDRGGERLEHEHRCARADGHVRPPLRLVAPVSVGESA